MVVEPVKGFDFNDWSGMLAPAGTPPTIVASTPARHLGRFAQPEVIRSMRRQGLIPLQSTSEEFAKFIESDQKKWG